MRAYSKRLLSPYTGQVQIVESDRARALTLDGLNWEIQFYRSMGEGQRREQGTSMRHGWVRIAVIKESDIQRLAFPAFLDEQEVDERIVELSEMINRTELPLPPADHYEYWLLDAQTEAPLALIYSSITADEMNLYPARTEWTALSAAMMRVEATADEEKFYTPPVNYRFEQLIAERAGRKPRARWINRQRTDIEAFPPCLVTEDWEQPEDQELCRRYIERKAPRLLMLHSLPHDDRQRLERAARDNADEVERFFHLYPQIADEQLMNSIRVEARLRQANSSD